MRELAPGFAALAIGARAGTAITAQIANMKVTSQVDAMKVLGVNPIGLLSLLQGFWQVLSELCLL